MKKDRVRELLEREERNCLRFPYAYPFVIGTRNFSRSALFRRASFMTDNVRHRQGNCVLNPGRSEFLSLGTSDDLVLPSLLLLLLLLFSSFRHPHLPFHYLNRLGL